MTRKRRDNSWTPPLHPYRRNLDPLRRLAHRRRLFPAGDLRLGARLLWPERLCRRAAAAARLADLADLVGHDVLLSVRRGAGRLCQRGHQGVRPPELHDRGHLHDGRGRDLDRPGARALAALSRQCRARLWLGRHQPRHDHQHARPVVRQQARHGDQPGAERRELWRHRRRAAAGGRDRLFRLLGGDDCVGRRDGRADGSGDPDLRRTAADSFWRGRRRGRGRAVADADPGAGLSRHRLPLGVDSVRAGAVRAGRLHRSPDLVPGFGDRAASARRSRWRC